MLGVIEEKLYKFLDQPMVGTSGYLGKNSKSDSCDAFNKVVHRENTSKQGHFFKENQSKME